MRKFSIEEKLQKTIEKLSKKDKVMYNHIMKKMQEILECDNVNHYKNLRAPLQDFKRVHIRGSFVLIFKYIEGKNKIIFFDFNHHDYVYNK